MSSVVHFVAKPEATAEANLKAFIEAARPLLTAYPAVKCWEDTPWDLKGVVEWGGRGKSRIVAAFTSFDAVKDEGEHEMSEPFLSFAKAYFLYQQALRPSQIIHTRLTALKALEKALVEAHGKSDVQKTTAVICNRAASLVKGGFSEGAAYRIGLQLTALAEFISEKRLATPFQWVAPIGRPQDRNRTGVGGDKARAEKMPSEAALDALPKCYRLAQATRDVLPTSVAALLCTAPDRIGEVFGLRVDCEVNEVHKGKPIYGLRWYPEKGGEPTIKWVAPTMANVAKEAVSKLRNICQPAREIAAWYEQNPTKIYLPQGAEYLRSNEYLTLNEVAMVLGLKSGDTAGMWIKGARVPLYNPPNGMTRPKLVRFDEFERAVLELLPKGFPIVDVRTDLKYSEALIVVRSNELHATRGTLLCMIEPVDTNKINDALGAKEDRESVFDRFGFREPDGSKICVSSHQFRHWLNTLAHRGGMSQIDIAKWSGRADARQNNTYNHMTGEELLEMTREVTESDPRLFGGLAELIIKAPVSRDEFMALEFPTAHITDFGFCVHDFTMLPCPKHRDCVGCNEHVCVKGDRSKTERIREQLNLAEAQEKRAEQAVAQGYAGSDRWHDHHTATVKRLRNLIEILDDPKVPEGSLIRLTSPDEFSPIRLAVQDRLLAAPPDSAATDELEALLGDE